MDNKTLTLLAVGDIVLHSKSQPAEPLFTSAAPVLKAGDLVIGQIEIPFTTRGVETCVDMFAPAPGPGDPRNLGALASIGFNVITYASNHTWDLGVPGVEDTINELHNCGIVCVGAGMNIEEARRPAIIERDGTKFGILAYNCVGPIGSWATPDKPGAAYVHIVTGYEVGVPVVGGYPTIYTFAEPNSLKEMEDDIRKLRPLCDVLIVCLHKGLGYIPATLAMYDRQVSYAAVDAGADLILGHHAHILKGIEVYKGKVIFHGLCDFVRLHEHLRRVVSPEVQKEFVKRHGGPFFFERDGGEVPFPPPERILSIIAKCIVKDGKITKVSYIPFMLVDSPFVKNHSRAERPEILKNDEKGQRVFNYMNNITKGEELNARFEWEGDEVVILPK